VLARLPDGRNVLVLPEGAPGDYAERVARTLEVAEVAMSRLAAEFGAHVDDSQFDPAQKPHFDELGNAAAAMLMAIRKFRRAACVAAGFVGPRGVA
jgi:hypothetical protein